MIILGTNSIKASGFDVDNSCRFNEADSAYLEKTNSGSSATDIDKYTLSFWVKRGNLTEYGSLGYGGQIMGSTSSAYFQLYFKPDDTLRWQEHDGSASVGNLITNRRFRDVSAWYHIVCLYDSGNATSGNRMQIWINGVRETSFSTEAQPTQNANGQFGTASQARRIANNNDGSRDFDGYIAEAVGLDGVCDSPVGTLGEFDEDSPTIWKPKNVSGLTFGTHGFYLDFKDSANLGNDANGGTDFGETNLAATDQATDSPTNNFATLNPLFPEANIAYSEGNTRVTADGSANWSSVIPTVGLANGKWYWEWKATSSSNAFTGIASEVLINSGVLISDTTPYDATGLILYFTTGRKTVDGTDAEGYFTAWSTGTMSAALDLDSGTRTIQMYHNGSATGSAVSLTANFAAGDLVFPVFMVNAGSNPSIQNPNFGNPNTANSSDAADANGYGAFEYAPPSGFFSICTKNLAEYG